MKHIIYLMVLIIFISCNDRNVESKAIARVNNKYLYKEDLLGKMPEDLTMEDSVLFRSNFINSWAMEQLLLQKAELNIGDENEEITALIEKYKRELLIDKYKQAVVQQELDTVFLDRDIDAYYNSNKEIFRLNENLVQLKYLYMNRDINEEKEIIRLFRSEEQEDLNDLVDRELEFNSFNFNDSIWISQSDVFKKLPFLKDESRLKKKNFMQKEDSLGVYLLKINNVLYRNDIAPKSYVVSTIKRMILHKRKLEIGKKIEQTLVNDAIENKQFELY